LLVCEVDTPDVHSNIGDEVPVSLDQVPVIVLMGLFPWELMNKCLKNLNLACFALHLLASNLVEAARTVAIHCVSQGQKCVRVSDGGSSS